MIISTDHSHSFLTVHFCLRHGKYISLTFLSGGEDTKLQLMGIFQRIGHHGVVCTLYLAYGFVTVIINLYSTLTMGKGPGLHYGGSSSMMWVLFLTHLTNGGTVLPRNQGS